MSPTETDAPDLVTAAQELDEQLRRFASASDALKRTPLDSQKHLERAAKALNDVATLDEELGQRVQRLVTAFTRAREQQQAQARQVQAHAEAIRDRTTVYQELLQRFGALGQDASALNGLMQQVANPQKGEPDAVQASFEELQRKMDEVVQSAEALAHHAEEKDFMDVARQADSLRQQLLAARNKLSLLHKRLSPPGGAQSPS